MTDTTLRTSPGYWRGLCERSHQISKEKGWLDTPRSWSGITELMKSELAEALEEYRDNRKLDEIYWEAYLSDRPEEKVEIPRGQVLGKSYKGIPKPCGIPIEFADFVIRVAQHCGTETVEGAFREAWDLGEAVGARAIEERGTPLDFEETLATAGYAVAVAWEVHRRNSGPREACRKLGKAVYEIWSFCEESEIDLFAAIALKESFNRTRPHRHGNKRI